MDLVFTQGNEVLTTSRKVADFFKREHRNVTRVIDDILKSSNELSSDTRLLNFEQSNYLNIKGREIREYIFGKRETILLIMKLQGPEAFKAQVKFVDAFELMEKSLKNNDSVKLDQFGMIKKSAEILPVYIDVARYCGMSNNQAILAANKAVVELTGINFKERLGLELINDTQEIQLTPTEIGKELGISGKKVNQLLLEKGFQLKDFNNNWIHSLRGSRFAVVLDVGKKHSNGTPITQLKWKQSVINELRQ